MLNFGLNKAASLTRKMDLAEPRKVNMCGFDRTEKVVPKPPVASVSLYEGPSRFGAMFKVKIPG